MFDARPRFPSSKPHAYLAGSIRPPARDSRLGEARLLRAAETRVMPTEPAVRVVTDFVWEEPVVVPQNRSIDDALREMLRAGVRALLVVRDDAVTGLITSYDIQGERPLQFLATAGYSRHDEIEVGHIMTPWERVPTFDWDMLSHTHVSDIEAIFTASSATHVVIVEHPAKGAPLVRGLVSRTRLERQLGRSLLTGLDRRAPASHRSPA
jgi:CBS-domain-containing membrane protein